MDDRQTKKLSPDPSLPSDTDSSGRTLGREEIELVSQALRSGRLTSTRGSFVRQLESSFPELIGAGNAYACASGSAAIHCAVAAIDPEPGDEIITTPVTDMGALTPILYQGAIPVFADVDPVTGNVTPETILQRLSRRTRAIVATHLFGAPCDMDGIMSLANAHGLPVIEDCAQAFLAQAAGRCTGTIGDIACFSLQQGKHITTGEGGIVATADDALARRVFLFINKAWGYGDESPDHYFLALNYRMSELQGAVAVAQLEKLTDVVERRIASAQELTEQLGTNLAVVAPRAAPGDVHSYWKYALRIGESVRGGAAAVAEDLAVHGIPSAPGYIRKPAFECQVFRERRTFGTSGYPFSIARAEALNYDRTRFPGALSFLDRVLVLPWNENYTDVHVSFLAETIRSAISKLSS